MFSTANSQKCRTFVCSGVALRVHHVAVLTGLAPSSVRWNAKMGRLKSFRSPETPKIIRFHHDDVEEFIRKRTAS
jgi:hypothetical protein